MKEKFDINNIALVRATDIIPMEGVIESIGNSYYIKKNKDISFSKSMLDLLRKKGVISPMDHAKVFEESDYYEKKVRMDRKILEEYIPYVSDYNSGVLFSLNGLVPDDSENGFGNNIFSNKKCAVIEPIVHHIDDVITIMPTDTFVEGDVKLSRDAIILIESDTYNNLSNIEKEKLSKLNVKTFTGNLKDVVYNELKNTDRYYPETLSLSRSQHGFLDSDTKEKNLTLINEIASNYDIPSVLYWNALTGNNDHVDKLGPINEHFNNILTVQGYYLNLFFDKLFNVINVNDEVRFSLSRNVNSEYYLEQLMEAIDKYGIDKYKDFIDKYNKSLEILRDSGELLTPNQIVEKCKVKNKKK